VTIWQRPITLEEMTEVGEKTMVAHLGIVFTEIGDDYLKGRMQVDHRTMQPFGIMHGGASCVLAETLGSIAGTYCVDWKKEFCVGLSINTNHLRMVRTGDVEGVARPLHLGRKTQLWEVDIKNENNDLVSVSRLTLIVMERR